MSFDKNIQNLVREIRKTKSKRIFLQVSEGLKRKAFEIINEIEKCGFEVILSGDVCYGACDLRINEALQSKCDIIVHIGHIEFPKKKIKTKIPVLYFPWKLKIQIDKKTKKELEKIKEKRIGIVTSIQYIDSLKDIKKVLLELGKKVYIGGPVLGCWTDNIEKIKNKIDAVLFVGSGSFHVLGLSYKKVYLYDVERKKLRDMTDELIRQEKIRLGKIMKACNAKSFALLVSSKPGQYDIKNALKIKKKLKKSGKAAYIIQMDEINSSKLEGLQIDAFINLACPRIVEDKFKKPIINKEDIKQILK